MKTFLKTTGWLVMAAALSFGIAACSSDDDVVKQPQNPTEPQVYTLVVKASKGDISTRALSEPGASGIDAYWSGEETIEVGQYNYTTEQYDIIGTATAAASETGETTITAELTSAPTPSNDLIFFLGGSTPDYTGQVGLLTGTGSISEKYDYASDCLTSGSYTVDNTNNKIILGDYEPLEFGAAQQAIIKFTLQDKGNENAAISPSALTVSDGTSTVELTDIPASTYTANGAGVLYVAFPPGAENTTITLTATVGEDTYTYTTSSPKTFYRGQFYTRTVKMTNAFHIVNDATNEEVVKVNGTYSLTDGESYTMSGIGSGDIKGNNVTLTIEDGTVLTGNMLTPYNGENNASIVLNGDFTLNGIFYNYEAYGPDKHYYDAGYATITSGDGNNHTLNVNGRLVSAHIHLAEHVTLRLNGTLPDVVYGYVKNADGSADIIPSEETIGSVTYNVYVGSGTVSGGGNGGGNGGGAVVTVWFVSSIVGIDGSYVVFNNDDNHVTLTDTGATYQNDYGETNKCYTAPLTAGATTYTVYNSRDDALASNVPVSDGDILIYSFGGSSWVKKYW